MENNDNWITPGLVVAIISLVITITGWVVSALLARGNNSRNLQKLETNRLIDELYYKLDFIYNEMMDLMQENSKNKDMVYFLFVASVRHIEFTCDRISKLDKQQAADTGLIAELRQACTDDRKYDKKKIGTTLSEIQHVNEKIKSKYIKKF